jgi:ATP synthase protein I
LKTQKNMQQDQPDPDLKNLGQQQDMQTEQTEQAEADLSGLELQNQISHQQALRFILTQLLATIVLSAILLIFDLVVAYSSLAGGFIATLANAWFAIKVFRVKPTVAAEALLTTFYIGEIFKFVFTGAMFVIAFIMIKPLSVVALLVTYFLIHMTPAVQNAFGRDDQSVSISREKK